ncbi:pirin family protein [Paenibacillus sp. UNC499MF]|uniref:pirin family protein n=1 Tax=Paenibacillus sp. UNC499MF TaxID=1502751 RepID=UPI0008A05156|nr:pirin family protein [Paenibacillus sp. UNC499MF]SEF84130.1 hypothetical protein SAMN02799616_01181 [Paenibacillus sp. UNC499MF]
MIKVHEALARITRNFGWLYTSHSFSFGGYFDPGNTEFGPLRVFNDDRVQPLKGFDFHRHEEMEIVTVVLRGELQHEDTLGNKTVTRAGEVQRMTAGTGIEHAETNPSASEEVELLQLWFTPDEEGLTPSYEQASYDLDARKNEWVPVVTGRQPETAAGLANDDGMKPASIHQDMTLYLAELEPGRVLEFSQKPGRRMYVFVIEGSATADGAYKLSRRDAARITEQERLDMHTETGARLMLIDLP